MKYSEWLTGHEGKAVLGLDEYKLHDVAMVNSFLRSEAYTSMKSAITGHLKTVSRSERFQVRVDMGVKVPESRNILYVAPDRCSLNNCMGIAVKHGVCEKHVAIWEHTYFPKEEGRCPEP